MCKHVKDDVCMYLRIAHNIYVKRNEYVYTCGIHNTSKEMCKHVKDDVYTCSGGLYTTYMSKRDDYVSQKRRLYMYLRHS